MNTTLILSTGRTGTCFFARLFSELYPEHLECHHASAYSPFINIVSNLTIDRLLPVSTLSSAWRLLKQRQIEACPKPGYLDSNNHLYAVPMLAPELYPGLKVIHIVRDPRDYVRSHLNWARHRPKSWIADNLIPGWQPNPWLAGSMPLSRWARLGKFEKFCWIWKFKNQYIERIEQSSIPYLRIRFEDFFLTEDPASTLKRLTRFIGLPDPDIDSYPLTKRRNENPHSSFPKWHAWSSDQCQSLSALCEPLMSTYGYGAEPEWQAQILPAHKHG